jgi:hypothetical protein
MQSLFVIVQIYRLISLPFLFFKEVSGWYCSVPYYFSAPPPCSFLFTTLSFKIALAFKAVITFLPVLASSSSRATLATLPPCCAMVLLWSKVLGFTAAEIS